LKQIGIWFFTASSIFLFSCKSSSKISTKIPDVESERIEKEFRKHRRWVYDCFKRYIDYSDFLDTSQFVTGKSVETFKSLFVHNAMVWNDYIWEPEFEYASVYADQVYYYHRIKGLKVEYDDDVLVRLYKMDRDQLLKNIDRSDPDKPTFKYSFKTRKGIYYILNKEQKVIYYDEPIDYYLEFIFHISSEDNKARIIDILPAEKEDSK